MSILRERVEAERRGEVREWVPPAWMLEPVHTVEMAAQIHAVPTYGPNLDAWRADVPSNCDPSSMVEETYVSLRYSGGERPETVAKFYEALRYWQAHSVCPRYEAVDTRNNPDLAFAAERAGVTSVGMAMIRMYRWQHREALRLRETVQ